MIADSSAVPTLIQVLLNDSDTVVRSSSAGALAKMGKVAVPELLAILESPDHPGTAKGQAAWALAFIGSAAQPYLFQALGSEFPEVRAAVIGAIAKISQESTDKGMEKLLIDALDDPSEMVRCEAAAVLGTLSYQPALLKLVDLLEHDNWETRRSAALALMQLRNTQALPSLKAILSQEGEEAVQKATKLVIHILEKQSIENEP